MDDVAVTGPFTPETVRTGDDQTTGEPTAAFGVLATLDA
jgi:hypothetical protein